MKKIAMLALYSSAVLGVTMMEKNAEATIWMLNTIDYIKDAMNQQKGDKQTLAVYRVQLGDTLSGISEAASLTVNQILTMNGIQNSNLIFVGQLINLGYGKQAKQFVQHQGQSLVNNQKNYTVPTAKKAKKP